MPGERNFHIFYLIMASCDKSLLGKLFLSASPDDYHYTRQVNKKDLGLS